MDHTTLTNATFIIKQGLNITGVITYNGTTVSFAPSNPLMANTVYTVTITTGATSTQGTPLAADYTWISLQCQFQQLQVQIHQITQWVLM
jgi:hypothetical protein